MDDVISAVVGGVFFGLLIALVSVWPAMLLFGVVHSFWPLIPAFGFWETLWIQILTVFLFGRVTIRS